MLQTLTEGFQCLFLIPLSVGKPFSAKTCWGFLLWRSAEAKRKQAGRPSTSACFYWQDNMRALHPAQIYPTHPEDTEVEADFLLLSKVAGGICLEARSCITGGVQPGLQRWLVLRSFVLFTPLEVELPAVDLLSIQNAPAFFEAWPGLKYVAPARKCFGVRIKKRFLMNGNCLWTKKLSEEMIDCTEYFICEP